MCSNHIAATTRRGGDGRPFGPRIFHPPGQSGPLVKRLRHRPFTAVTRVRVPYGSPIWRLSSAGRALASHARGHRFEFCSLHHVVADCISFATTFLQTSSLTHSVAPPLQTEPATLGFGLVLATNLKQRHLSCWDVPECVDKKDAPQKRRTKVRRFCIFREKLGKTDANSSKFKNVVPFLKNHGFRDAEGQKVTRTLPLSLIPSRLRPTEQFGGPQAAFFISAMEVKHMTRRSNPPRPRGPPEAPQNTESGKGVHQPWITA